MQQATAQSWTRVRHCGHACSFSVDRSYAMPSTFPAAFLPDWACILPACADPVLLFLCNCAHAGEVVYLPQLENNPLGRGLLYLMGAYSHKQQLRNGACVLYQGITEAAESTELQQGRWRTMSNSSLRNCQKQQLRNGACVAVPCINDN
jgi:hypothetical protein